MTMLSIGDLAGNFTSRLNTTRLKEEMLRLNAEVGSGRPADLVAHTNGDTARLALIERDINLANARAKAADSVGQSMAAAQTALDSIEAIRSDLADRLVLANGSSSQGELSRASEAGAAAFRDIVDRLNTDYGGMALFAGSSTGGPAVATADAMMASLRTAASGATTADDLKAAVDAWFSDPAGGFASLGYLGDTGPALSRRIDENTSVKIEARADHPAIKSVLRSVALTALASDPALGLPQSTQAAVLDGALDDLLSASEPLTDLRADLGMEEERAEEASTRNKALAASLTIMRNDLAMVDSYATSVALKDAETQLELQYTLTSRLSGLSLVNFLK